MHRTNRPIHTCGSLHDTNTCRRSTARSTENAMSTSHDQVQFSPLRAFAEALAREAARWFRSSIAIVVFLGLWEGLPRLGWVDATFLPPFSEVLRALAGFAIAIAVGVPLGLVIGWYRGVAKILNPLLEVFRNTAPLAILPVFVLILGMGEISKVSMVVYSCLWPIVLNTVSGVRNVDPLLIRSARSMALSPLGLFYKVVLPASVPTVFTGIRVAGAYSILVLIAAEMVGAKAGLGYLVNYSQFTFEIPKMYAGIVTLSLLGLVFNQGLVLAEQRLTAWKGQG